MTATPLRLLLAEDSDDDAMLVLMAVTREGYQIESTRVMTGVDFQSELETGNFDIILCDYEMFGFDALEALEILRESGKDIPLIIVSGAVGEVVAVEAMRHGAADYLLKDNLIRLGAAVGRELREAEIRRQKRLSDSFSRSQMEVLEMIFDGASLRVILEHIIGRVENLSANEVLCSIMLVNEPGTHLTMSVGPSLPPGYLEALGGVAIRSGIASCGTVVAEDVATHPDYMEFGDLAAKHGLRGCWSVPILSSDRTVIGVLGVYHRVAHSPTTQEIQWVESASKFASLVIERMRILEKLRESDTLLRVASKAANIGGWIVDFQEARVIWSDQVCHIHEVPPGTSPAFDRVLEFLAPEWRKRVADIFEKCLFEGAPFDEEMQVITDRGRLIWVRAIGEGVLNEGGTITRIQGAFQDITLKKQAAEDAARMAQRMTLTLESITDAFFTVDRDWRFTYLNHQAGLFLKCDRAELLGKRLGDEFPEDERGHFDRECRRAVAENCATEFVAFYPSLDRWFEVRGYPSAEGFAVYFHDVTESRKAQEHLKLLENCVSRINDIVIITDAETLHEPGPRILFVNDAFVRLTGFSREEVLGRSPRFLQGPKTQRDRLKDIGDSLQAGRPVRTELINYKKSGEEFWLDLDIVPVLDPAGVMTHLVAVERDVTERKLAEATMRADEIRHLAQRNALIALNKDVPSENFEILDAFRRVTETTAKTLEVARVSIWRYTVDLKAMECLDLYELESGAHTSGVTLVAADYPAYFKGLDELELIAADDARTHPLTCEFAEGYLVPLGITAMMDVPIHHGNAMRHVLCNEHIGPPREWTADEKTFAVAIGNQISLVLVSKERARAQHEVLQSHQRFQSVAAATNDTIWDWNLETDGYWWNDGFASLFGWKASEMQPDTTVQSWIRQIHPADRDRVVSGIYYVIQEGYTHWVDEYRFVSNDGTVAWVLDRGQVIRDEQGKGIRMVGGMTDLTARKAAEAELARSQRALHMLSLCNEMLVRASDENDLLAEACRIAVSAGGYRMAWVGYAMDDEGRRIVPMAHSGIECGYLSEVEISWAEDQESGRGPAGQAIRTGQAVMLDDLAVDSEFSFWSAPAKKRGYRSLICIPLCGEGRPFGVLCLYAGEPHPPRPEELKMLQEMANNLAFGIANLRGREERQRTQEVVVKVAQAVSSGVGLEFFDLLTRKLVDALGAYVGLIGRFIPERNRIEALSYVVDGKLMDPVGYDLNGTPCETLLKGEICVLEQDVQQLFPDDHLLVELGIQSYVGIPLLQQDGMVAGIMAVLFTSPLRASSLVSSTLTIFAARAAAELDRQQADARIREQASLLDKAQDAILVRGLDHKITYWNKSAERLYGWTAEEAVGRPVDGLLYRDVPAFLKAHAYTLVTGEWIGEMHQIDKTGRDLVIEGRWTLVRDENNQPVSVLAINTDISEYRKLEHQFLRAQRLESMGTLAGGIAHDLNNILAPVSMAVELLKMRVSDARSTELLDTIATSAARGANMVGQVLSFARGVEGTRVEIHPRQLISEIEKILRDTIFRNVALDFQASRRLWSIYGDPTQLHQLLLNLCLNARDAIPDSGEIHISAENVEIDPTFAAMNLEAKAGSHVCIQVRDSGEGIPAEIIDKIFDPFFTTKATGKGTGLGLSTSLAIVRSHGGFIRVFSKPGEGTCFRVYLPASPELAGPVFEHEPVELPRGQGETVLIVDDETVIRQVTRQTLEAHGYRTLLAANGEEALACYAENQAGIAVVLTDMMMPVMDGTATIQHLLEMNPAVRIIATSGIAANRNLVPPSGTTPRHFLPKPYTAESLLKCLRQVMTE